MKLSLATVAILFTGLSAAENLYGTCSKLDSSCDVGEPTVKTCEKMGISYYHISKVAYSLLQFRDSHAERTAIDASGSEATKRPSAIKSLSFCTTLDCLLFGEPGGPMDGWNGTI